MDDSLDLIVFELDFHKFYHANPGKLFDDKAESMIVKDLQKIYNSRLEELAKEEDIRIPNKKNIKSYTHLLRIFKFYEENPDSAITVFPDGQSSPIFTAGMTTLYDDVNSVMKWAEDDFNLYKKNLKYNKKEVKIAPWKRIVAGIVIGTTILTTAVSGFIFSYIFDKKVENLEVIADAKIKKIKEVVQPIQEKIAVYEQKFNEYEVEIKSYLEIIKDEKGKETINPKLNKVIDLAAQYFDDKYREVIEDNIYESVKEKLPEIIRGYFQKEYDDFKKNPDKRNNLYKELETYINELVNKLSNNSGN